MLATGEAHSVREFVEKAFACVGRGIVWQGSGASEKGIDKKSGMALVQVDPRYFRPTEVDILLGDPTKARKALGWKHSISFDEPVRDMIEADLAAARQDNTRRARTE